MKKIFTLLSILCISVASVFAEAPKAPTIERQPNVFVYDTANIIPDDVEKTLNGELPAFHKDKDVTLFVVTVPSLNGYDLSFVANELFNKMSIGGENNKGVLLLVSVNDKKVRIESGYGCEEILTDAKTRNIIEEQIIPEFKNGNFHTSIINGVKAMEKCYEWEARSSGVDDSGDAKFIKEHWLKIVIALIILFTIGCATIGVSATIELYLLVFRILLLALSGGKGGSSGGSGGRSGGGGSSSSW